MNQSPPEDVEGDQEVRDLKDMMMNESMTRRGRKAMMRSLEKKKDARDKFNKYLNLYKNLSGIGDKGMNKA